MSFFYEQFGDVGAFTTNRTVEIRHIQLRLGHPSSTRTSRTSSDRNNSVHCSKWSLAQTSCPEKEHQEHSKREDVRSLFFSSSEKNEVAKGSGKECGPSLYPEEWVQNRQKEQEKKKRTRGFVLVRVIPHALRLSADGCYTASPPFILTSFLIGDLFSLLKPPKYTGVVSLPELRERRKYPTTFGSFSTSLLPPSSSSSLSSFSSSSSSSPSASLHKVDPKGLTSHLEENGAKKKTRKKKRLEEEEKEQKDNTNEKKEVKEEEEEEPYLFDLSLFPKRWRVEGGSTVILVVTMEEHLLDAHRVLASESILSNPYFPMHLSTLLEGSPEKVLGTEEDRMEGEEEADKGRKERQRKGKIEMVEDTMLSNEDDQRNSRCRSSNTHCTNKTEEKKQGRRRKRSHHGDDKEEGAVGGGGGGASMGGVDKGRTASCCPPLSLPPTVCNLLSPVSSSSCSPPPAPPLCFSSSPSSFSTAGTTGETTVMFSHVLGEGGGTRGHPLDVPENIVSSRHGSSSSSRTPPPPPPQDEVQAAPEIFLQALRDRSPHGSFFCPPVSLSSLFFSQLCCHLHGSFVSSPFPSTPFPRCISSSSCSSLRLAPEKKIVFQPLVCHRWFESAPSSSGGHGGGGGRGGGPSNSKLWKILTDRVSTRVGRGSRKKKSFSSRPPHHRREHRHNRPSCSEEEEEEEGTSGSSSSSFSCDHSSESNCSSDEEVEEEEEEEEDYTLEEEEDENEEEEEENEEDEGIPTRTAFHPRSHKKMKINKRKSEIKSRSCIPVSFLPNNSSYSRRRRALHHAPSVPLPSHPNREPLSPLPRHHHPPLHPSYYYDHDGRGCSSSSLLAAPGRAKRFRVGEVREARGISFDRKYVLWADGSVGEYTVVLPTSSSSYSIRFPPPSFLASTSSTSPPPPGLTATQTTSRHYHCVRDTSDKETDEEGGGEGGGGKRNTIAVNRSHGQHRDRSNSNNMNHHPNRGSAGDDDCSSRSRDDTRTPTRIQPYHRCLWVSTAGGPYLPPFSLPSTAPTPIPVPPTTGGGEEREGAAIIPTNPTSMSMSDSGSGGGGCYSSLKAPLHGVEVYAAPHAGAKVIGYLPVHLVVEAIGCVVSKGGGRRGIHPLSTSLSSKDVFALVYGFPAPLGRQEGGTASAPSLRDMNHATHTTSSEGEEGESCQRVIPPPPTPFSLPPPYHPLQSIPTSAIVPPVWGWIRLPGADPMAPSVSPTLPLFRNHQTHDTNNENHPHCRSRTRTRMKRSMDHSPGGANGGHGSHTSTSTATPPPPAVRSTSARPWADTAALANNSSPCVVQDVSVYHVGHGWRIHAHALHLSRGTSSSPPSSTPSLLSSASPALVGVGAAASTSSSVGVAAAASCIHFHPNRRGEPLLSSSSSSPFTSTNMMERTPATTWKQVDEISFQTFISSLSPYLGITTDQKLFVPPLPPSSTTSAFTSCFSPRGLCLFPLFTGVQDAQGIRVLNAPIQYPLGRGVRKVFPPNEVKEAVEQIDFLPPPPSSFSCSPWWENTFPADSGKNHDESKDCRKGRGGMEKDLMAPSEDERKSYGDVTSNMNNNSSTSSMDSGHCISQQDDKKEVPRDRDSGDKHTHGKRRREEEEGEEEERDDHPVEEGGEEKDAVVESSASYVRWRDGGYSIVRQGSRSFLRSFCPPSCSPPLPSSLS